MALLSNWWLYDLLLLLGFCFLCFYIYVKRCYLHWKKQGISEVRPAVFPFGHARGMGYSEAMVTILQKLYMEGKQHKIFGAFLFWQPILLVTDMELVKTILVKDFSFFRDRGFEINVESNPLFQHLFAMKGQEWRNMRIRLTPTFTSGKMKMMFPTMFEVGAGLEKVLKEGENGQEIEVKDILSRYTTDVISKVAFGIDSNSLEDPDAPIRKMAMKLTTPSIYQAILNTVVFIFPIVLKLPWIGLIPKSMTDFFMNIVKDVIDYREKNNIHRNDFMQLLIQLKNLGYIPDADNPNKEEDAKLAQPFTVEQAAAQAFIFYTAGFEPASSTLQFTLYELALNPDVQQRLHDEIDSVNAEHKGEVTYDTLQQMDYLERVISETLRKYPVAGFLIRECNTDYKVPESEITIKKGTKIWFPLYGYQRDSDYYPDPDNFDPDRFLPEETQKRPQYSYLPFGEGPRNCIGNRFALMQAKAGLFIVMSKFRVSPSRRTPIPLVLDPKSNLAPNGQMHLAISRR